MEERGGLQSPTFFIPRSNANEDGVECQCGKDETIQGLENDIREAARVGQALLIRHETYVADAERERERMNDGVARLENSNNSLEARNVELIHENEELKGQLNSAHNAASESEDQIQALTATLQSAQREIEKLSRLASRAEDLELQLLECEREQAQLQATFTRTVEEERAATQRWKEAQRKILELELQLDAIEKDAREERKRHAEVTERFERRQVLEARLQESVRPDDESQKSKNEVVSSFVKEILQDNANMQLAVLELQDVLAQYKDAQMHETEQQLDELDSFDGPNLGEELGLDPKQPELHVHHHYHAPAFARRDPKVKPPYAQRPKRKRQALRSGRSTPTGPPSQRPSARRFPTTSTSSIASFEHPQKRWSTASSQSHFSSTFSSSLNSPQSTSYCPSTVFEQGCTDGVIEYSRPTSPESNVWSPVDGLVHKQMEAERRLFQPASLPSTAPLDEITSQNIPAITETANEHEVEDVATTCTSEVNDAGSCSPSKLRDHSPRRKLHRTDSATSFFSISGMDIHTSFPDRSYKPPLHQYPSFNTLYTQRGQSSASLSATNASATGHSVSTPRDQLRGTMTPETSPFASKASEYNPLTDTLGSRVGGWLSSRLNGQRKRQTASHSDLRNKLLNDKDRLASPSTIRSGESTIIEEENEVKEDTESTPTPRATPVNIPVSNNKAIRTISSKSLEKDAVSSSVTSSPRSPKKPKWRGVGVNQLGGLPPVPMKTPVLRKMDETALKESLEDEMRRRSMELVDEMKGEEKHVGSVAEDVGEVAEA